jgi:hypothetical protein
MYEQRNFLIFPVTELPKVDFSQVCETSIDTVRKSVDETKTFVKWDGEAPAFIAEIIGAEGPYTYEEILVILATEEWTSAPVEVLAP